MALLDDNYKKRLIDDKISKYISVIGALSVEGVKYCGKTSTALHHGNTAYYFEDEQTRSLAELEYARVLEGEKPIVMDEWANLPHVWDAVRRKCDDISKPGNFILTCSSELSYQEWRKQIFHSGAGRFAKIKMYPMSLYESGNSTGKVSITDMYNGTFESNRNGNDEVDLKMLAYYIVRGGWPQNLGFNEESANILPRMYLEDIINQYVSSDKVRDKNKIFALLRSLARNESTICSNNFLLNDTNKNEKKDIIKSKITLSDYLDKLSRLYLVDNQEHFRIKYKSYKRLSKGVKRHFVDPSLACAALDITVDKLLGDIKTFNLLFEALVERDLKIYMDLLDGNLYHFRDNVSGLSVDAILKFNDDDYAAVEIELGFNKVEEAITNLVKFSENMIKKPKFMCVVVGKTDVIARDEKTGIYVVPITALKP